MSQPSETAAMPTTSETRPINQFCLLCRGSSPRSVPQADPLWGRRPRQRPALQSLTHDRMDRSPGPHASRSVLAGRPGRCRRFTLRTNLRSSQRSGTTMEDQTIAGAVSGEFVTETFEYDGGRQVTVYIPPDPPEAVVFAGDGQFISRWGEVL